MRIRFLSVLAAVLTSAQLWADVDVTDLYLQNAGFDDANHFDYKVGDNGNVSQEILPIYGWYKDIGVDYTVTGVYEYGTAKTFNTYGKVPSAGYNSSKGGCLALSTGWEQSLKYYQPVKLLAGSYKLQSAFFNGSNSADGTSLLGWLPGGGSAILSSVSAFPLNVWTPDEISFSLSAETEGRIQIGFKGVAGGSANSAKVVADYVRLILVGDNAMLTANLKTTLQKSLSTANSLYGTGSGKQAANLKQVLDDAQVVYGNTNSSYSDVFLSIEKLEAQMVQYRWANSTLENPIDFSQYIVNPSFEDGFTGWQQYGLSRQSNTSFSQKSGGYYVEKWVTNGSHIGDVAVRQVLANLPKGIYILKAGAQNTQNGQASQIGAWIVGGNDSSAVSAAKEYELQFTVLEDAFTIGFAGYAVSGNWVAVDNFRLYYVAASLDDYKAEMTKRIGQANDMLAQRMTGSDRDLLQAAVKNAEIWKESPNENLMAAIADGLQKAVYSARVSVEAYGTLADVIELANSTYSPTKNGAEELKTAIDKAIETLEDDTNSVSAVYSEINRLKSAILMFKIANANGSSPVVETDIRYARGATMAFGRAKFSGSDIRERGFCWATHKNPTVADDRSSLSYSNNGDVYVMEGLQPATVYYIRPYAITNAYAVGYGECIKLSTLPKGGVSWSYNNGGSDEENGRINAAVADAVDIWNNLTSIQGLRISVSYGTSTPTADCSYGGSMRVGPNASYQRTGTIQHEMCHAAGVGTIEKWKNSAVYRENVSRGFWLGERTDQVLHFLENDNSASLKGDDTHFWPYGVNGAHEDDGSRMLYYANALIIQALGEDFLPPVYGAFASPAYTFTHDDDEHYYVFPADADFNASSLPLLKCNDNGSVGLDRKDWRAALLDQSCAWVLRFNPASQLYEFRNASSNMALTGGSSVDLSLAESFGLQLLGSRQPVANNLFTMKSYWITFANGTDRPNSLAWNMQSNSVSSVSFNHQNSASQQRWIILSGRELKQLVGGDFTDVPNPVADVAAINAIGGKRELLIETGSCGGWISIFNVQGQKVDYFYLQAGLQVAKPLPSGVYVVNGKKVVVLP